MGTIKIRVLLYSADRARTHYPAQASLRLAAILCLCPPSAGITERCNCSLLKESFQTERLKKNEDSYPPQSKCLEKGLCELLDSLVNTYKGDELRRNLIH